MVRTYHALRRLTNVKPIHHGGIDYRRLTLGIYQTFAVDIPVSFPHLVRAIDQFTVALVSRRPWCSVRGEDLWGLKRKFVVELCRVDDSGWVGVVYGVLWGGPMFDEQERRVYNTPAWHKNIVTVWTV